MKQREVIDFVVTWVDSSDPKWLEKYQNTFDHEIVDSNRFTDMGLFKYWFRAVEEYAPWVNKVHVVTFGHIPEFLNLDHPKINVVYHSDYIPKKYLPTFNSHTIENNLHRIPGLADKFVYFNDDMYLTNNVQTDYFFKNGMPKHLCVLRPIVSPNYYHISEVQQNNNGVINQNFDLKKSIKKNRNKWFSIRNGVYFFSNIIFSRFNNLVGFHEDHMPTSILKATMEDVWQAEPEIMNLTCKNKKRNIKTDINQWVFKSWQIMSGTFEVKKIGSTELIIVKEINDTYKVEKNLYSKNIKMICVNDHVEDWDKYENINNKLKAIFEKKYYKKSTFEI